MNSLSALLRAAPQRLSSKRVAVGFDGFADRILRPIRRVDGQTLTYFSTIADFGTFLTGQQGKSCSIALDVQTQKIGGNCPIFSAALGWAGVQTDCVGMFTGGAFDAMPPACTLHSYADVGTSDCLEFSDGKVMLASRCTMAGEPYAHVAAAVPSLPTLFGSSDLVAFLNWAELDYAGALWDGVEQSIFAPLAPDFTQFAFFDLCDFARKSNADLEAVLALIGRFSCVRRTILSLNENECLLLGRLTGGDGLEAIARAAAARYGIHEIVVHTLRMSYALYGGVWHARPTIFCKAPVLSTGAGDNFNAGYALGLLLSDDVDIRLALANLFASRYITSGRNFDLSSLAEYADSL